MVSHNKSVYGLISGTVESRCSNDVIRTVSVLFSSAGFNLISVIGKLSSPRGEVEERMARVDRVDAHRIGTFG